MELYGESVSLEVKKMEIERERTARDQEGLKREDCWWRSKERGPEIERERTGDQNRGPEMFQERPREAERTGEVQICKEESG